MPIRFSNRLVPLLVTISLIISVAVPFPVEAQADSFVPGDILTIVNMKGYLFKLRPEPAINEAYCDREPRVPCFPEGSEVLVLDGPVEYVYHSNDVRNGQIYTFYKVQVPATGEEGYMAASLTAPNHRYIDTQYLEKIGHDYTYQPVVTATQAPVVIPNWTPQMLQQITATVEAFQTAVAQANPTSLDTVQIWNTEGDGLSLRDPNNIEMIIDTLEDGTLLTVIGGPMVHNGITYWKVSVHGETDVYGWVAERWWKYQYLWEYSQEEPPLNRCRTARILVTEPDINANMRSGPGTGYSVIGKMHRGGVVVILEGPSYANGLAWYRVRGVVKQTQQLTDGWIADVQLGNESVLRPLIDAPGPEFELDVCFH